MKKLLLISWSILLLLLAGCSDFLEPKSSDEYVPENATALDELLVQNAYTNYDVSVRLFMYHNLFGDDITVTDANVGFLESESLQHELWFSLYTMQPDMFVDIEYIPGAGYAWDDYYKMILGCNAALDYLDKVKDTEEMKRYVAAQALALRAFYYFNLVNLFGAPYNYDADAPGVPLKLTSNLTTERVTRNSVREVYEQICEDLTESDSLFRLLPSNQQFDKNFRISLPAVRFLRSRVNLYMENYAETIRWADSVLQWREFRLYDLASFVPSTYTPKPHFGDYTTGEVIWCYGSCKDLTDLTGWRCYEPGTSGRMSGLFVASPDLLDSYAPNDTLRSVLYILDENESWVYTGRREPAGKVPCNQTQGVDDRAGFALSFRLSELYLNLAEAYAMSGNDERALYYLNALRRKRIKEYEDLTGLAGEALIQFVKEERRRELCFEGHRWFDLRRWGMEAFTRKWKQFDGAYENYVIEKNDPAFTLPIPEEVLRRNPGLEQNPLAPERQASL